VALAAIYPFHRFEVNFYWAPWEFAVNVAFCVLAAWGFLLAILLAGRLDARGPANTHSALPRSDRVGRRRKRCVHGGTGASHPEGAIRRRGRYDRPP
jgi:hypothetical protein